MILGVDVSHYDARVDWQVLKSGGVEFGVVKVSQGDYLADRMAEKHLAGARSAGLLCGVYHWLDPLRPVNVQVDFYLRQLRPLKPEWICLDVEQYWADWAAFPAGGSAKRDGWKNRWEGKKKASPVYRLVAPHQISESARLMAEMLRQETRLPVVIYTRTSFIKEYARPMLDWLAGYPLWLAQYPLKTGTNLRMDWDELRKNLVPSLTGPALPEKCAGWTFWQFSGDSLHLPGMDSLADLNLFQGDRSQLEAFCHSAYQAEEQKNG